MKPKLALLPAGLHGFLKVSATLGNPEVRLARLGEDMPVLQLEEAGVVIELEFVDQKSLVAVSRQIHALVHRRGRK